MVDVSVIGAGAVATDSYLPALRELPSASIRWVVDLDGGRASDVARRFGANGATTSYEEVLASSDAVIVTTPPASHASISEDCLEAGVAVMIEKPVATSSDRAASLVSLSERMGVPFAISRQQREAPACRILKSVLERDMLGPLETFEGTFGDETNWAFASDYRLDPAQAWGGALTDKAPHLLDLLVWVFDEPLEVERYRDDSYGGLEANAELELRVGASNVPGRVEITASRSLPNELRITGESGELLVGVNGASAVLTDRVTGDRTWLERPDERAFVRYRSRIAKQAERFIDAVDGGESTVVPAREGVPVVELIETCYAQREPWRHSWEAPSTVEVPEVVSR